MILATCGDIEASWPFGGMGLTGMIMLCWYLRVAGTSLDPRSSYEFWLRLGTGNSDS